MSINSSIIRDFIDRRVILEEPNVSIQNTKAQPILKIIGISLSALGKVPFIPINLKLKSFGQFRYILTGGNIIGFWALGSWSIINIVDDLFKSLAPEEKKLLKDQISSIQKISSYISAMIVSGISQGVIAYLAYEYNDKNVWMSVAIMASDVWFPFYSTLLSSRKAMQKYEFSEFEKELNKMKQEMILLFEKHRQIFINMSSEQKRNYLRIIEDIKTLPTTSDRINAFLPRLLQENVETQTKVQQIGKAFFGLNGLHFSVNHLILLGIVSYIGGEYLTSSQIGGIISSVFTVLSTFYLEAQSNITTAQRFFSSIYNIFTHQTKPTLMEQLRPKLTFTLKAMGLLTAALVWGPTVQVSHDYIKEEGFKTYMQITGSLAVTLLVATAILDIIDDIVAARIIKNGTEEELAIFKIHTNLKKLIEILDKSSLFEFAKFAKMLPVDILQRVQRKFKITESELAQYLDEEFEKKRERFSLLVQ